MVVKVRLEYHGGFSAKTGKSFEEVSVSTSLTEAYDFIMSYIASEYSITPPFIMMLDHIHITGALSKHKDVPLKDGNAFKFLPSISGG